MTIIIGALILLLGFGVPASSEQIYYVVKRGDTLSEIAHQHGISWQILAEFNGIEKPSFIREGATLRIPGTTDLLNYLSLEEIRESLSFQRAVGKVKNVSAAEKLLLARLIHAESRGESMEGQVAVAAVVLNRVKSPLFPGGIAEVIYQPGQFTPVELGVLPVIPNASCHEAAARALAGEDPTNGALYFYNPVKSGSRDFWETRTVIKRIGNHNFAL